MTGPANPLMVALTDRSGTAWLLPDGVSLTVDYLSKHRLLGYKRATITAKGPRPAVFELLETLRYGVKIYSATDPAVWLGLVEGVNVYDGENRVGLSLRDMANRVAVAYSYVEPGTSTVGVRKTTAWANDTASQGEFGVKEYLHSSDGTTDAGAVQLRDTFLADHALPVAARTYAGGLGMEAGEITASIECIGWIMTLGWEYYADSSTTNTATSTQISNILSAAQFINSVAVETASGISTSRYRKGDETMLTELLALMEMGTTNGKTYQLAIDEARNVRVFETPADTTVSYRQRVDGQVLSTSDEPIDGYRVEAGTWIELKDALPGSVDTTWMRYIGKFLIEEVEWTASRPDKPRLTPAGTRGGGVGLLGGTGSGLTIPRIQAAIRQPQRLNVVVSTTALTVGTHTFTRATHFPSIPAGARAVELNVLGRWSTPASATTRATVTGDGGTYMLLTNKYQWGYESGWAKVYLDDGKFTVTVEGENMNSTAITIRGYEM